MIYTTNKDVPGIIGTLGKTLGDNKINIAKSKDYIFGFSIIEKTGTFEELKLKIKNEYAEIFKIIKQEKMDIIKIWHYFPDLLKSYSNILFKQTTYDNLVINSSELQSVDQALERLKLIRKQ